MTQQHENVSAFVDGELQDEKVLSELIDDQTLADKWQHYHLIRGVMRKEMPPQIDLDLGDRIMASIDAEPTVLAPRKTWRDLPVVAQVIPLVRQGGQFAVAASVAAAMIIGVQQLNQTEAEKPFSTAPPVAGVQGGLAPVSLQQTRSVSQVDVLQQRKRINAHLADHRQQVRFKYAQQQADNKQTKQSEQSDSIDKSPK